MDKQKLTVIRSLLESGEFVTRRVREGYQDNFDL
jgi:hypothetical protein